MRSRKTDGKTIFEIFKSEGEVEMADLRGILFDCDGVLAETERTGHRVAFNRAFEKIDLPFQWDPDEYGEYVKIGGGKNRVRNYLEERNWDFPGVPETEEERKAYIDALHREKSQAFVEIVDEGQVPAREGVKRLIEEALERGLKVAIVSSSAIISVEKVLQHVVGEETAQKIRVFGGEHVAESKPNPALYLHALDELGLQAEDVVVVEDTRIGCLAGVRAGCRVLVTPSDYSKQEDFSEASAVVSSLGSVENRATLIDGPEEVLEDGCVTVDTLATLLK